MIRKTIFWIHLSCGVCAGIVVAVMSLTGVLLTYERQVLAFADRGLYSDPAPGAERLGVDALVSAVELDKPDARVSSLTFSADARAPVSVGAGRAGSVYVNAYTGEALGPGATGIREFFNAVTGWHRWFNLTGQARSTARVITDASNLIFLFLILSGMYLWLPRVYKWAAFKAHLMFSRNALRGKARDFNWHHVIGIWTAIPLAVIVATAVVFSYGWANDLVYRSVGEEPPARGRPPGPMPGAAAESRRAEPAAAPMSLDALLDRAAGHVDGYGQITMQMPRDGDTTVRFTIDQGNGGQPTRRHGLTLDRATGKVAAWEPFSSQSPGRKARTYIRFLHTGEALGPIGQTVAGFVSLTSLIMVWTGLALAYRRLIQPLFRRRTRPRET